MATKKVNRNSNMNTETVEAPVTDSQVTDQVNTNDAPATNGEAISVEEAEKRKLNIVELTGLKKKIHTFFKSMKTLIPSFPAEFEGKKITPQQVAKQGEKVYLEEGTEENNKAYFDRRYTLLRAAIAKAEDKQDETAKAIMMEFSEFDLDKQKAEAFNYCERIYKVYKSGEKKATPVVKPVEKLNFAALFEE